MLLLLLHLLHHLLIAHPLPISCPPSCNKVRVSTHSSWSVQGSGTLLLLFLAHVLAAFGVLLIVPPTLYSRFPINPCFDYFWSQIISFYFSSFCFWFCIKIFQRSVCVLLFIVHPSQHMWSLSINCCLLFSVSSLKSPESTLPLSQCTFSTFVGVIKETFVLWK